MLESGVNTPVTSGPQRQLVLLDVVRGTQESLARGVLGFRPEFSPDRKWAACVKVTQLFRPDAASPMPNTVTFPHSTHLLLVALQPPYRVVELPAPNHILLQDPIVWSPNGSKIAFFNRPPEQPDLAELYIYSQDDASLTRVKTRITSKFALSDINSHLTWTGESQLLVRTQPASPEANGTRQRPDWYAVEPDGSLRNLTAAFKEVPTRFLREWGTSVVLQLRRLAAGQSQYQTFIGNQRHSQDAL